MADERAHTTSGLKGRSSRRRRASEPAEGSWTYRPPSPSRLRSLTSRPRSAGSPNSTDSLWPCRPRSESSCLPSQQLPAVVEQYDGTPEMVTGEIGGHLRNRVGPHRRPAAGAASIGESARRCAPLPSSCLKHLADRGSMCCGAAAMSGGDALSRSSLPVRVSRVDHSCHSGQLF
jgi:hypothetical protein